jgi:hypothetical protein
VPFRALAFPLRMSVFRAVAHQVQLPQPRRVSGNREGRRALFEKHRTIYTVPDDVVEIADRLAVDLGCPARRASPTQRITEESAASWGCSAGHRAKLSSRRR